jgi:acetyl-CoA synthetase
MLTRKGDVYLPEKSFQQGAWVRDKNIYRRAKSNPIKFWETAAKELAWFEKWKKAFVHKPPYFEWFQGGKTNITYNCLERNLETRKNKVALIWEPESLDETRKIYTYYDLYKEVNKFASGLKSLGVKKGDRVGIYLPMIPEVVISMLACARIGAVHTVVFSAFSSQALQVRLQDTGAKILITADGYFRAGKLIDLKKNADAGIKRTSVEKVVVVKRANNAIKLNKRKDILWDDAIDGQPDYIKPAVMDSEDLQFILYTSGSTGKPKGIVHTCGGYMVQSYLTSKLIFDLKDDDIFWSTADIGWITGHTYSCYGPLLNGATFVIFEGLPNWPEPDRWCDVIEKYGVTTFYTAPTAIRMFQKQIKHAKQEFNDLQLIASVGEPINEKAWNWYFEEVGKKRCSMLDTWWQTETGGILITSLPGVGPFKPTFAGLPFPGVKIKILNEKGKKCKKGEAGNLVILPPYTPGMLRGVYKNQKKYLETYWAEYGNKIYFTSDGAYQEKSGLVRIVGRVDDVIKVAGHRVSTGEIEDAITKNKHFVECAVIGMPDEIKGEVPAAFVALASHGRQSLGLKDVYDTGSLKQEVMNEVMKSIGPISLPKEIYFVDDLPKTRSGKIMRRILKRFFTGEDIGDISTLANPESVAKIKKIIGIK